ncbi:hypothetical protein SAMN06295912_10364 [Sphingomonas laterariae]|uniref:LVIVD repeat-containing protein n=1 Tax=Edaphosphingomonas laterariae TaxID=861865 RepID=A0A239CVY5_9SPHN|nr:hypothetical protein [Sphingomonas laterariae]SNS24079.1 hypothetical protein SAMN06295912_10364 [Sphingomonas laterariae]
MSKIAKSPFRRSILAGCAAMAAAAGIAGAASAAEGEAAKVDIRDPIIKAWHDLTYDQRPPMPVPGVDYGIDPQTGAFHHPKATPLHEERAPFPGQLDHWEQKSYAKNMEVIAFYPHVPSPFHTWQNIADFNGKRYLYVYDRLNLKVFDITDPAKAKLLLTKGQSWTGKGGGDPVNPFPAGEMIGAASIQWNKALGKYIMVQSNEVQRFGIFDEKMNEPDGVDKIRKWPYHKGFNVYVMNGPLPDQWERIATRTTDYKHPDAQPGHQQGSGSLDVPAWFGGQYMFLSSAPDDSFALTEYPNYLYSPGYQAWDMSDPKNPKFLSQFSVPGQIVGVKAEEDAYLKNPRAGNRTSWMGSRMPIFIPKPVEKGGKFGFAAMGGLGFYVLDISNPAEIKVISHLDMVPKFAGTEADNIDVSQYERTGFVFMNGYPMNDDCFEPYKDIFAIDVRDPNNPKIATTFPRPTPPADAPFKDFCERRGSFGPKRPGYFTQPGTARQGIVPYAFYNAGVQLFDVQDPANPKIAAYYIPRFPTDQETPDYVKGNLGYGTYVEYDRNILWLFTNHGFYALKSPLLGEPKKGVPAKPWPPRD